MMIGFENHSLNPRSGRPEAPPSWRLDALKTWQAWLMAMISAVGAAFIFATGRSGGFGAMAVAVALLFAVIAFIRHRGLARKKDALRLATRSYDEDLAKPLW